MPASMPAPLANRLTRELHTRALCWTIVRLDGVTFYTTTHDVALRVRVGEFGQYQTFEPIGGVRASAEQQRIGFDEQNLELAGILTEDRIQADDMRAELYNGAEVTRMVVDWQAPHMGPLRTAKYFVGNCTFNGSTWEAQMLGLARKARPKIGRVHSRTCDADLGDARCGVDLGATINARQVRYQNVRVAAVTSRSMFNAFNLDIPAGLGDGWFTGGRGGKVTWTTGQNAEVGHVSEVQVYAEGARTFTLSRETPYPIAEGDFFDVVAGCNGTFSDCTARFSNATNFRGFHLMPATDRNIRGVT